MAGDGAAGDWKLLGWSEVTGSTFCEGMVLVSAACGTVISAAVPSPRIAVLVTFIVTVLLLSVAYAQVLQSSADFSPAVLHLAQHKALNEHRQVISSGSGSGSRRSAAEQVASLRWRPRPPKLEAPVDMKSFSVVLPCAFEGEFAEKTVWAIWENTDKTILKEIIVVDDGSRPPLKTQMSAQLLEGGVGVPKMRIVRHEQTLGLISAKKSGGDAATGDVVVFFDCHVSPRKGWEHAFLKQMRRKNDHRTIVVPTITSLNPDTWKEIPGGGGGKVCFILWNNDFTWLYNPGRDAPLMSGGLLALSRRWWEETEGYDTKMVAWGGENIDQSLRSWLCGGRIEVAEGAYVAHMWRDPKNPKTVLRYPIPTKDVMRNKARAANAWFGEFVEKVMTFPEYEMFTKQGESIGDMGEFEKLKKKLGCAPFTSYLDRFSYIYFDGGLIPDQVFQLRARTFECEIGGASGHQKVQLSEDGQLLWNWQGSWSGAGGCLAPQASKVGNAVVKPPDVCSAAVEPLGEMLSPGVPRTFILRSREEGGGCAAAGTKQGDAGDGGGLELQFRLCDDHDPAQRFTASRRSGGYEIRAGDTEYCLDSAGGRQVLVYPCYDAKQHNVNQIWTIRAARLLWEGQGGGPSACIDSQKIVEKVTPPQGEYRLATCALKPGQHLKREDVDAGGSFLLKDQHDGRCLASLSGNVLGLAECSSQQRWRVRTKDGWSQLQHDASKQCIDAGQKRRPILYPCHPQGIKQPQRFSVVDGPGWIQTPLTWGDNGRRRTFETCLDRLPVASQSVAVQDCAKTRSAGVQWERHNAFVPLERRLWDEAAKPPPGTPVLGGDMAPP
ncbi:unnamed protein product [Effrenium voratum]|nr:unnamed protein product [Effrenium voratum]